MADTVNRQDTTYNQLLFADHGTDFGASPATAANSLLEGTQTDIQIDLTGLADGSARQSAKSASLWAGTGSDEAALYYVLGACLEWETAPTDNDGSVDFYWAPSPSGTAGTGNPGGASGSDSSFTMTAGIKQQLILIGSLVARNNVININPDIGVLVPKYEYGTLIVDNQSGGALRSTATAMDETHITLTPRTIAGAA